MSEQRRLVIISDIHLHPWAAFSRGTGAQNTRLQQTLKVLENSLKDAEAWGHSKFTPCAWLCAGDFVHTISFTNNVVLNSLIDVLSRYPDVPKFVVWGNHDSRGKGRRGVVSGESVTHVLEKAVPNFTVLKGRIEWWEGLSIFGCGAQPNHEIHLPNEPVDIGLFHTMVTGSETGTGFELEGIDASTVLQNCRVAIVGDVHQPQLFTTRQGYTSYADLDSAEEVKLDVGENAILVPGSPEHHNFGDRGPHGYWKLEYDHECRLWMLEGLSPKFLTVDTAEAVGKHHYYRVLQPSSDLPSNAMAMASPPTTVEQRDLLAGLSQKEILDRWIELHPPPKGQEGEYLSNGSTLLSSADLLEVQPFRIRWIQASNFLSYEAFNYKVEDGVTLVVGESCDFSSNGAGKSTIFEALYWALFGKTTKDVSADEVMRWGTNKAEVIVRLELDGKELVVRRTRKPGAVAVDATYDGEGIVGASAREITDQIIRLLGVTPDVFRALAYYSQEKLLLFSQATDAERKELLADLAGLGAYQAASVTSGEGARQQEQAEESFVFTVETLTARAKETATKLSTSTFRFQEWEAQHGAAIEELKETLGVMQAAVALGVQVRETRLKAFATHREKWLEAGQQRLLAQVPEWTRQFAAQADKTEAEIKQAETPIWHGASEGHLTLALTEIEVEVVKAQAAEVSLKIKRDQAQLAYGSEARLLQDAEKWLVDTKRLGEGAGCPTCGQVLAKAHLGRLLKEAEGRISTHRALRDEKTGEYEHADTELVVAQGAVTRLEEKQRAATGLMQEYERHQDVYEKWEKWVETMQRMADDYRRQAAQLAQQKADAMIGALSARGQKRHARVGLWAGRMREAESQRLSPLQQSIALLEGQGNPEASAVTALQGELDDVIKEVVKVQGQQAEAALRKGVYQYWQHAFSKQGIQSLLLEGIAAAFNLHRTMIFPMLTRGVYDVQFSTISHTATGEQRERSDFLITYRGSKVAYANLSGGQRRRIDVGVLLTLALANATTRQVPGVLGTLILDEVFDFLDTDGAEALVEVLDHVQKTIPAIFVITQDAEMQSLFGRTLLVEQGDDGVSRLVE